MFKKMSTIIERKVKKRPIVVHRPKKVVNSQDKSLHRSMLSHSRIATGYKKKIAALLGNNRALAHALEMAHVELTNRDKLTVELQRRLTLQSPKRFKSKLQKVCEHLHVIVALLQDVLDDCDDFAEPTLFSFSSQTSNSSRPDNIHARYENESPSEAQQHLNKSLVNNNIEINSTPFPISQQPPRLTTAAEMSAILEQSVLLADENMPPILFPEDENQVISNITTRPKSKSRSASSQLMSRGSKIHTESPQSRKSINATTVDIGKNLDSNSEVGIMEVTLPPSACSFNLGPSPKQNSTQENSPEPPVGKNNCLDDSQNQFESPKKTSNSQSCVKKKIVSRRKSKKKILVVKLPCTPKRSLARENMVDTISPDVHSGSFASEKSPNRRKTFTVNKKKKINRRTFVLSAEATKETVSAAGDESNSEHLESHCNIASSLPEQLCNGHDKNENNSHKNVDVNSAECRKGENNSGNTVLEAQSLNIAVSNNSCKATEDMDLTCHILTENSVHQTNAKDNEIFTDDHNKSVMNGTKPISNSRYSSLMYGYDPLEGTSKNRKSSILLKKPKEKRSTKSKSSKIPQIKEKLVKSRSTSKPSNNNKHTKVGTADAEIKRVNADSAVMKKGSQKKPTKSAFSSALKDNSLGINSHQKPVDLTERLCHPVNSEQLESNINFNSKLSKTFSIHSAINKSHKKSITATRTESGRDQEISSLDSVQPVVKLNDIWTSVKTPSSANHCDNYVYIPDVLDGSVLKVDTTPKKQMLQSEKELNMQNSNEDIKDALKVVEAGSEKACNSDDTEDSFNSGGIRKRRGASSHISYKEPSLIKKLRQGDPFTSNIQYHNSKPRKEKSKRKARSCASKRIYFEDDSSSNDDSEGC